jgi:hypothetical protein
MFEAGTCYQIKPCFFENVVKQIDYLISEAKYAPL